MNKIVVFDEKHLLKKNQEQMKLLMKVFNLQKQIIKMEFEKEKRVQFKTKKTMLT